ncbi:hypothetical protein ADK64_17980 [Streptomyces sp. MMG1121]|nr:hypothetical protein ADK64_17980 [Streptomyces sp. MMG1121]
MKLLIGGPEPVGGTDEDGGVMSTFLAGEQPVEIVPRANREPVRLRVEGSVADVATLGEGAGEVSDSAAGPERRSSL